MKSNSKIHMYYTEGSQRARDYVGFNKQLVALPGCDKGVERGALLLNKRQMPVICQKHYRNTILRAKIIQKMA